VVKVRYLIIAILLAISGAVVLISVIQSDEHRIKRAFGSLAKWASKEEGESNLTMVQKTRSIGSLCAKTCHIEAPETTFSGAYSSQQIAALAARTRIPFTSLSLRFDDLHIELLEKGWATVRATAQLEGIRKRGERLDDTRELECRLQKVEGKWLFTHFELVKVLER
jgi:hypothetical protein